MSNPKTSSLGGIGGDSQLFSYTKSTQNNLQLLTILVSIIFLILTIFLMGHFYS